MFNNNYYLLFNQYESHVPGNMINKPEEKKSNIAEQPGNQDFIMFCFLTNSLMFHELQLNLARTKWS